MKKQNLLLSFLAMFFGLSLVFSSQFVLGQDSNDANKEVKVKIVQNVNGETTTIEKIFSAEDEQALKELLKEFDLNIDSKELLDDKQIEISIHKSDAKSEGEDVIINLNRAMDDVRPQLFPRAFLGVIVDEVEKDESTEMAAKHGVVIAKVMDESAAEKAGIQVGDLITKVNDTEITGSRQFQDAIRSFQPGEQVTIYYQRDGQDKIVQAELGEKMMPGFPMMSHEDFDWHGQMPPMMKHMEELKERPFLGVVPGDDSENSSEQKGVTIGEVIEKSTAQDLGLQKGDVITEINDKQVSNFDELRSAVREIKVGDEVKVEWTRNGEAMTAAAPIRSKAECKAICIEKGMMPPHCSDMMMKQFQYKLDDNKEAGKEAIEKAIGHLEKQVENLKEQLHRLEITGEAPDVKTEETKITITIEDVNSESASKNSLDADNLSFSPNPGSGKFNLSFELEEKGKTEVRIFDASNKEVYSESLGKFSGRYDKQIDISNNPKGIYFLQITQGNRVLNKKIVIQ